MKIKAIPGKLELPAWLSVKGFCDYLRTVSGTAFPYDRRRKLFIVVRQDVTCGLNIYVRDQTKYYSWTGADLRVVDLRDVVEFNYFFIRHDTGCGLFTHYRGCFTSLARFGQLLRVRFNDLADDQTAQARSQGKRRKYTKRGFRYSQLFSKTGWEAYLRKMQQLLELNMRFATVVGPGKQFFTPKTLSSTSLHYRFKPNVSKASLISAIKKTHDDLAPRKASVRVINQHGDNATCHIGRNLDVFESYDHDEYVDEVKIATFTRSRLMQALLEYKDHRLLSTMT